MEFVGRHSQIYGNHNVPIHVLARDDVKGAERGGAERGSA